MLWAGCAVPMEAHSDLMGLRGKAGKLGVKYINMKVCITGNVIEGVKEKGQHDMIETDRRCHLDWRRAFWLGAL